MRRVPAGARGLYVKCFVYPTAKDVVLRIVSRRFLWHRARREWKSIGLQQALGLPSVERVCLGEIRRLGILRAAVLVTEEVLGARRLDEWLRDPARRPLAEASVAVARYVALLHRAGFLHGDLNARNVLVRDADGAPEFRNVDSGRGLRRQWKGRLTKGHARDLAPLALALGTILGLAAAEAFLLAYAAEMELALGVGSKDEIEAEIARVRAKELARLSVRNERERAPAQAGSERGGP